MRHFTIPKRSGGVREIYAPDAQEKDRLRELLPVLDRVQQSPASHAFRPQRGVVTAATPHIGMAVTISLDLSDFFDHCTLPLAQQRRVPAAVIQESLAFVDGAARQGLPTSPQVANICAGPLDEALTRLLRKMGHSVCLDGPPLDKDSAAYTRYADDLSISLKTDPGQDALKSLIARISDAARRCGFAVNPRKTRIQRATRGRREIVGVLADAGGLHPTRRHRRKLRAALYNSQWSRTAEQRQRAIGQAAGLSAWCQLTPPHTPEEKAERAALRASRQLESIWRKASRYAVAEGLHALDPAWGKAKTWTNQTLAPGIRITVDPMEFLKMGNVRYPESNSYSCMRRRGGYYSGVVWWAALPGAALGVMDGTKSEYRARVVLYELRDGRRFYGRVYGNSRHDRNRLTMALENAGIQPLRPSEVAGQAVKGYVPLDVRSAYLDFGSAQTARMTGGVEKKKLVF